MSFFFFISHCCWCILKNCCHCCCFVALGAVFLLPLLLVLVLLRSCPITYGYTRGAPKSWRTTFSRKTRKTILSRQARRPLNPWFASFLTTIFTTFSLRSLNAGRSTFSFLSDKCDAATSWRSGVAWKTSQSLQDKVKSPCNPVLIFKLMLKTWTTNETLQTADVFSTHCGD